MVARVVQARTGHDDLPSPRVGVRKDGHEAAINVRPVPGIGAEIVLPVDGEQRRTRLFRSHEQAELVGAIADTRTMFEGKAGRMRWFSCSARSEPPRVDHATTERAGKRVQIRWIPRG
jgi:hypothetical protein